MPSIDILMPVRNVEPFVEEAVKSIMGQTFTDWRLITVDDQSDDNTWALLCCLGKADDRILPLKNEGNGIVHALNTALDHSTAPYLARMDGDDVSSPRRLEKLFSLMNSEPEVCVAGSRVALFPPDVVSINMRRYIRWQNSLLASGQIRRERYVESTISHATSLFRRDTLIRAGGWREGPYPEDLDLWLRLHREDRKFIKHPEYLYLWREHDGRETRRSERCTPRAFHYCKVMHLSEEMIERNMSTIAVLGPVQARHRWTKSLSERDFDILSAAWKPGEPIPREAGKADFVLVAFGVPNVRERARKDLGELGKEDERWLFVG